MHHLIIAPASILIQFLELPLHFSLKIDLPAVFFGMVSEVDRRRVVLLVKSDGFVLSRRILVVVAPGLGEDRLHVDLLATRLADEVGFGRVASAEISGFGDDLIDELSDFGGDHGAEVLVALTGVSDPILEVVDVLHNIDFGAGLVLSFEE
jgi:hypothetical protein